MCLSAAIITVQRRIEEKLKIITEICCYSDIPGFIAKYTILKRKSLIEFAGIKKGWADNEHDTGPDQKQKKNNVSPNH